MASTEQTHSSNPAPQGNIADLSTTHEVSGTRWDWATTIDESLWSKSFPYQLAIVEVMKAQPAGLDLTTGESLPAAPTNYSVHEGLIFTLPINPEQLAHGMPFAISAFATLNGVVEQHGGVPFRPIQFAGTFGVVADRPSAVTANAGVLGAIGGVFAGTIEAARGVTSVASSLGIGSRFTSNLSSEKPSNAEGDILPHSTGYYQFRALQRFLETYAEAKKTSRGRDLRLALIIWKEEAAYICTPLSFDVQRSAQRPFEYMYSLKLQAWSRVNPKGFQGNSGSVFSPPQLRLGRTPSLFAKGLTYLSNGVRMANQVKNVMKAFRADVDKAVDTMRQVALFVSAVGGIVKTALALPRALRASLTGSVVESWDIVKGTFDGRDPVLAVQFSAIDAEVKAVRSGQATTSATLRKVLSDDSASDFHVLIRYEDINLDQIVRNNLEKYTDRVLLLNTEDFRKFSDQLLELAASFADMIGLGDDTYDKVTGHVRVPQIRAANDDDYRALHALASAARAIGDLVVQAPTRRALTTIEYVAGLANAAGIEMRVPQSKFAVPFPYGGTLERLALQYLGDASRWIEIAALNDLRAPYVDEAGTSLAMLTNGSGNIVTLAEGGDLLLGQQVTLWSSAVVPEKKRVVSIRKISPTQWEVVVDGDADLAKFKTTDAASVQWFTPATVNSQKVIYIPSDNPADPDIVRYVPNLSDFDRVLNEGDIDGMLTGSGDLVVTPDGDWPVVFGLSYLVQWARIALNTKLNSLSLHPDFGVTVGLGDSIADTSAKGLLDSIKNVFAFNPSFTGINSALIQLSAPATSISLELGVRGSDAFLPLQFSVSQ